MPPSAHRSRLNGLQQMHEQMVKQQAWGLWVPHAPPLYWLLDIDTTYNLTLLSSSLPLVGKEHPAHPRGHIPKI